MGVTKHPTGIRGKLIEYMRCWYVAYVNANATDNVCSGLGLFDLDDVVGGGFSELISAKYFVG